MVNETLAAVLETLSLPPVGREYVLAVANSPPSRKVGSHRNGNLIVDVPSQCEDVMNQAESYKGEYLYLLDLYARDDVIGVYDQPEPRPLLITDCIGRATRTSYTADYLVVFRDRVVAYEVKHDGELQSLVQKRPDDWKVEDGTFQYLPAVREFAALGIEHVTVSTNALSDIRGNNLQLLASARCLRDNPVFSRLRRRALKIIEYEECIRIGDVLDRLEIVDATPILQLIDERSVFVHIDGVLLGDPRSVWVSQSPEMAVAATQSEISFRDALHACSGIAARDIVDPRYELETAVRLALATSAEHELAQLSALGGRKFKKRSARSTRRYALTFKQSGEDPRSLIPGWGRCGNTDMRVSVTHEAFIVKRIRISRADRASPSIRQAHSDYVEAFSDFVHATGQTAERPVSRKTFRSRWHRTPPAGDYFEQGGRRLGNAMGSRTHPEERTIYATRPFAVAHIDHWQADIHVVVGRVKGKVLTARPWVTAMVDAFTGEVLAIWIGFSPPSKKACSMVVRDCVDRHRRVPEIIVVDSGSDFRSVHFFTMLAFLRVARMERPPEEPRFGKEVERMFGAFKERFVRGLPGFGISIAKARAISSAFHASRNAELTLQDLTECFMAFIFKGYNSNPIGDALDSPTDTRVRGLAQISCCGRHTEWDLAFLIATSIEAPSREYRLYPGKGVRVGDEYFSSAAVRNYRGYKKDISVRLEPFDDSVIYVCLEGTWRPCMSSRFRRQGTVGDAELIARSTARSDLKSLARMLKLECDRHMSELIFGEIAARAREKCTSGSDASKGDSPDRVTELVVDLADVEALPEESA